MVNAGRILIIPQGEWTNLTNYQQLDLVTKGDVAYIARRASVGVDPSTDVQMTYWQPFGTAAKIATDEVPGLVMPDGTTITIDSQTGLIAVNLNVDDIKDVTIANIADGDVLQYNSTSQKWENKSIASLTDAVKQMIAPLENGATTSQAYAIGEQFIRNNVLYKAKVAISSGASFASLVVNTDYEAADTLTAQLVSLLGEIGDLSTLPTTDKSSLVNAIIEIKNSIPAATSISYTGTASATGVRYQRVGIGSTYTEINGTKYMEQTKTLSTSADTTYTFTNAAITADSVIQPYGSIFGIVPSNITTSAGSCVVTIPKNKTAVSLKVRIYIR